MKQLYLLFLLAYSVSLYAQSVENTLILKDAVTNLPIEDVTVYIIKTKTQAAKIIVD